MSLVSLEVVGIGSMSPGSRGLSLAIGFLDQVSGPTYVVGVKSASPGHGGPAGRGYLAKVLLV